MNLALFDFDGTITVTDTFSDFVRSAIRPTRIMLGSVLLSPIAVGYRWGWVSATRARPLVVRFGFRGEQANSVRALGLRYATDVLPGLLRRHALDRIEWHKQQGDVVVVVSAGLDVYLDPWCKAMGVQVICTRLEQRGGILTGRYIAGDCSGAEKTRRILEQYPLYQYSVVYAYGDTAEDPEMLNVAHRKFYRWAEISDWSEVTDHGHPATRRAHRRSMAQWQRK